ncbi:MAG: hypothetical protein O7B99_07085 [Planctomycetota bacterium]|nr:hypothetical protein [Planctomycetota bacterium]
MLRTVLLACLLLPGQEGRRPPVEQGEILELWLPREPGTRVEHFRLELPRARGAEGVGKDGVEEGPETVGLVRLRFGVDPPGGFRLECESRFHDAATRVLHVERLHRDELRLTWREIGERHGRTVFVEWPLSDAALHSVSMSGGEIRRSDIDASGGALMPLYLLEKLRAGAALPGSFRVYDPRSEALELLSLRITPIVGGLRVCEWHRSDGALAGRYLFADRRLIAFQWQAGGPVARAISADEFKRVADSWEHSPP